MIQNWKKQGQIYPTRAQCPTVLKTTRDSKAVWRIFFAGRNDKGQSYIRYIDVSPENPKEILFEEKNSLLPFGPPGSFDHFGQMPTCIIEDKVVSGRAYPEEIPIYYLFYIGWGQRLDVPYHNSIGMAHSYDGKTFHKSYPGPVIGTSRFDPYFTGTACVVKGHNDTYLHWCYYLSCNGWESDGNKLEPTYRIKEAVSRIDINNNWMCLPDKDGVVVDFKSPDEGGICNATVFYDQNRIKHMWFCYRKKFDYRTNRANSYRIGYAAGYPPPAGALMDGSFMNVKPKWVRHDELVNLPLSESGWDSDMICYPNVVEHQGKLYMFYNGNGFGITGFGYATLDISDVFQIERE